MSHIWDIEQLAAFIKYGNQLELFCEKMGLPIKSIIDIFNSENKNKLSMLKQLYDSVKKTNIGSKCLDAPNHIKYNIKYTIDNIYGWVFDDPTYIELLYTNDIINTPSQCAHPYILNIGSINIFENIKRQFYQFRLLNIYSQYYKYTHQHNVFNNFCNIFELDPIQSFNLTQEQLTRTSQLNGTISLITIFMVSKDFIKIDEKFKIIYNLLEKGGYLIIKEYNLEDSDQIILFDTYYDIYRAIYDKTDISTIMYERRTRLHTPNYKSSMEWISYIKSFKLHYIGRYVFPLKVDKTCLLFRKI